MADDNEPLDVDLIPPEPIVLTDDCVWVSDPDLLHPDAEADGVLALMYRGGCLFYLDGATRQWVNAEAQSVPKRGKVKPVN